MMETMIQCAMTFVGTPYIWGGSGYEGIDCSGLVQEILKSTGDAPNGDHTAHGLYLYFLKQQAQPIRTLEPGSLCFYGTSARIIHIAFGIDDFRIIEAGGGTSKTATVDDAIKANAFVRIRPYDHRSDLYAILRPVYSFEKEGWTYG
jgi:cell wall-associated NlpC family hydrolase